MIELPVPILSFLFGVLSIFTPCVLPVIPIIAAYAVKAGRFVPLALACGFSISYFLMGIVALAFGQIMYSLGDLLWRGASAIIIIMGVYILLEERLSPDILSRLPSSGLFDHLRAKMGSEINGVLGGLLLGATLSIVWIPCTGPILGSFLAMIAMEATSLYENPLLLLLYSSGMAVPFLAIAYGSNLFVNRVKSLSSHLPAIRTLSGIILILTGIYFWLKL
ncbi:MAG: cytochrome c biogenesis CcdA family protein [Candidatus Syntropharchaeales archaeon]|nr:cytochrome c biogenesis CcdA family protein [Candidatus Syntrophoarchaeum sp.]